MGNNRRVVLSEMDSNVKSRNHLLHLLYQILSLQDNRTKKSPGNHLRESQDLPTIHSPHKRRRFNAEILNQERVILTPLKNIRLPSFLNIGRKSSKRRGGRHVLGWMRNATELQEAGVKFKAKESGTFLDVSFNNGVMEIPTLYIFQNTLPLLRNLIAFEQYYPRTGRHFTFFADLMDSLIDTPKDVMVLQAAGILKIGLSNQEEVAEVFNRLCRDVYYYKSMSYLSDMYDRVNYYCDSRWHRYRTVLARDYFNNPWTIISVVAAGILLLLTFLQTLYSMLENSTTATGEKPLHAPSTVVAANPSPPFRHLRSNLRPQIQVLLCYCHPVGLGTLHRSRKPGHVGSATITYVEQFTSVGDFEGFGSATPHLVGASIGSFGWNHHCIECKEHHNNMDHLL
ncbi:hypothetical protein QJS10_CPB22g01289 [Acorus calamus]|uniref:Uncharacterized protein n=1 Tax=Acorus calamus TaxID=4465 RepID=A0AAV9BZU5_ACOCL|nr:hypothetical protein QJS10_CPB22g01289 [Acorus calamus]